LTPSYPTTSTTAVRDISEALHKIARARNFVRLAQVADPLLSSARPWNELTVTAERLPSPGPDKNPQRTCPDLTKLSEAERSSSKPFDIKLPQAAFHCDLLKVFVLNTGQRDVDVNVSYVDSGSGITNFGRDCTITLPPGGRLERSLWTTTWNQRLNQPDSIGREHIVVTAIERKGPIQANLCFIQEAVRGRDSGQARNGAPGKAGWLLGALEQAALADTTTRGAYVPPEEDAPDAARAGMYLITLQVTPPVTP
jgi:hypothetical protein